MMYLLQPMHVRTCLCMEGITQLIITLTICTGSSPATKI